VFPRTGACTHVLAEVGYCAGTIDWPEAMLLCLRPDLYWQRAFSAELARWGVLQSW